MPRTKQTSRRSTGFKYPLARKRQEYPKKMKNIDTNENGNCHKMQLLDLLSVLKGIPGTFAVDGVVNRSPLLGLHIAGVGPIPLPLCEIIAKEIIKIGEKAPYGLGEETIIDENIRKCWEIDPSKISIKNPMFHTVLKDVVLKVKNELGCDNNEIKANLYKLLLYEEGGHFKPHTDSEKEDGMFATLIIQLPSYFKGNHLIVHHNGCTKKIEFDKADSENEILYAAHFADCQHEILPLESGYRLCLIYNLVWMSPTAPPSLSEQEKLCKCIVDLLSQIRAENRQLGMTLDHQYSESALKCGIGGLKGKDRTIAAYLKSANNMLEVDKKFDFYLIKLKRTTLESGDYHYGYDDDEFDSCEVLEDDTDIAEAFDFYGNNHSVKNMLFNVEEDLIDFTENYDGDIDEFWGDHDDEYVEGPTGNAGSTRSRWYYSYILVICPEG